MLALPCSVRVVRKPNWQLSAPSTQDLRFTLEEAMAEPLREIQRAARFPQFFYCIQAQNCQKEIQSRAAKKKTTRCLPGGQAVCAVAADPRLLKGCCCTWDSSLLRVEARGGTIIISAPH